MDATLIVIDSDTELVRARAVINRLMETDDPPMLRGCGRRRG
jgi:hypothetical protein